MARNRRRSIRLVLLFTALVLALAAAVLVPLYVYAWSDSSVPASVKNAMTDKATPCADLTANLATSVPALNGAKPKDTNATAFTDNPGNDIPQFTCDVTLSEGNALTIETAAEDKGSTILFTWLAKHNAKSHGLKLHKYTDTLNHGTNLSNKTGLAVLNKTGKVFGNADNQIQGVTFECSDGRTFLARMTSRTNIETLDGMLNNVFNNKSMKGCAAS
jgi:hypothetical protein